MTDTGITPKIEEITTELIDKKNENKRKRKKEKKEKRKQMKLDYEAMKEQDMEKGLTVSNDDVKSDIDKYTEYKENMTGPLDILDGLFKIDEGGELYFRGKKQDTDANHQVNRHVIKVLQKEINQDVGEDEPRMVNISNRNSFDTLPLSDTQNSHKNTYVKRIREQIKKEREFDDEQRFLPFEHGSEKYFLKHKTRKPIIKKGVHFEEKEKMERALDQVKGMDQRVIELEAENSLLRAKKEDVGPHNHTMANRPDIIPELEPLRAQALNVDSVVQLAQPGPYQPYYIPPYRSPMLHNIRALFHKDKHNFRAEHDKEIFGPLFNPDNYY